MIVDSQKVIIACYEVVWYISDESNDNKEDVGNRIEEK